MYKCDDNSKGIFIYIGVDGPLNKLFIFVLFTMYNINGGIQCVVWWYFCDLFILNKKKRFFFIYTNLTLYFFGM